MFPSDQDDGSHTRMTRKLGAEGLISPTLSLSLRLTRAHFQGNTRPSLEPSLTVHNVDIALCPPNI